MTRFASLLLSCSCNLATFPDEFFSGRALARPCCRPPRPIAKLGDSCNLATSLCVILVVLPGSLTRWEWRSYRNSMRISSGISAKCSVPHLEVRTAPAPLPAYFCIVCRHHMPHLYAGIQMRQNTDCRCRKNIVYEFWWGQLLTRCRFRAEC